MILVVLPDDRKTVHVVNGFQTLCGIGINAKLHQGMSFSAVKRELAKSRINCPDCGNKLIEKGEKFPLVFACPSSPEHNTNSDECWCDPDVEETDEGKLVIHKCKQERNQPAPHGRMDDEHSRNPGK